MSNTTTNGANGVNTQAPPTEAPVNLLTPKMGQQLAVGSFLLRRGVQILSRGAALAEVWSKGIVGIADALDSTAVVLKGDKKGGN